MGTVSDLHVFFKVKWRRGSRVGLEWRLGQAIVTVLA